MNRMWNPDLYMNAWNFASRAHIGQHVPGTDVSYLNHIGNVAMEAMTAVAQGDGVDDPDLLVQCAVLHDVIEDTEYSYDDIKNEFGATVADGVLALTKNSDLPAKQDRMKDSLARIKEQPHEVWMVKLCDRITNLQPPPNHWDKAKIGNYLDEAKSIHNELGPASANLADRLQTKIDEYARHT